MSTVFQIQENMSRVGYELLMEKRIIDRSSIGINRLFGEATLGKTISIENTTDVIVQVNPAQTLDDEMLQYDSFSAGASSSPFAPTSEVDYVTLDKGYSVIPEISYIKPKGLQFTSSQLGLREFNDMGSTLGKFEGGLGLQQMIGVPQREYEALTDRYTEKYLALEMIKALSRSYRLAKPVKAKDGSLMTELKIANKLNSNADRNSYMTYEKILAIKKYMVEDLGHMDDNLQYILTWNDVNALWEDMSKIYAFNNSNTALTNLTIGKVDPMHRVALATRQVQDIIGQIGGEILLIHPQIYDRSKDYLDYLDNAVSSNTDDVNSYTATNNVITKAYCCVKNGTNANNLFKVFPTAWYDYKEGGSISDYYMETELINGIFFFKRFSVGSAISGKLGPSHKANLIGRFYLVREDNRNIIEIHNKVFNEQDAVRVNVNNSRIVSVDQTIDV